MAGPWKERPREDWNEWKDEQDEDLEDLYRDDEDDLLPGAPRPGDGARGGRARSREIAPAGTSIGQVANFANARSGAASRPRPDQQATAATPTRSRSPAPMTRSPEAPVPDARPARASRGTGARGGVGSGIGGEVSGGGRSAAGSGGTPLDDDLFSMLNMEDDEFDSLFGPTGGANPLAAEMAEDAIFSERGRRSSVRPVPPGMLGSEGDEYWGDAAGVGGEEGDDEDGDAGEADPGQLLKGLLGGSGLETLGQDWNEEEDWDDDEDEVSDEGGEAMGLGVEEEDDEDAFLAQFDTEEEEGMEDLEGALASSGAYESLGEGARSSENSDEEPILDKLRQRNPHGAAALDIALDPRDESEPAAQGGAPAADGVTQSRPQRDLDAIFGARPAQPAPPASGGDAPAAGQGAGGGGEGGGGSRGSSKRGVSKAVMAEGRSSASPSSFTSPTPAAESASPDWWLRGADEPPPLGMDLRAAGSDLVAEGAAGPGREEEEEAERAAGPGREEEEEAEMAFGPAVYNSREMEERRILETAAEKLLASMDGDDDAAREAAEAEYLALLDRAGASSKLNKRLGGNLAPVGEEEAEAEAELPGVDDGDEGVDKFLEASMFGWTVNAEGGDAAVYNTLIDEIDGEDADMQEGEGRIGWPARSEENHALRDDGTGGVMGVAETGAADEDMTIDVTSAFRQQVEKSRADDPQPRGAAGVGAGGGGFAEAFQAKALRGSPRREDVFESDALLEQMQEAVSSAPAPPPKTDAGPGPALPGRKSMDATVLQSMMAKVQPQPPPPESPADSPPAVAAPLSPQETTRSRPAGVQGEDEAARAEVAAVDAAKGAVEQEDEDVLEDEADVSSLLASPVPVEFMNSLGLISKASAAAALPSTAIPEGEPTGGETVPTVDQLEPITGSAPAGCAGSVMTYNALVSVLQQRVDSKLESLMGKIDAQAMAARREMLLTQLTPEAIALTCLTDVLEKKIVPMQDTMARLGPRMRDVDLDWQYKERLWSLHDRLQNDFKFRMLFVPSYVRKSWQMKKESIRAGSLEVRAVPLRQRRNVRAHKAAEQAASDGGALVGARKDDDDDAQLRRASSAWEKLKQRAREQRPGSRTLPRGAGGSATLRAPGSGSVTLNDRGVGSARAGDVGGGERPDGDMDAAAEARQEAFSKRAPVSGPVSSERPAAAAPALSDEDRRGARGSAGADDGAEALIGAAGLPISEDMSLADIRKFIREQRLEDDVKTSGAGRTKVAILQDVARIWLARAPS